MKDASLRYLRERLGRALGDHPDYSEWPEPVGSFDDVAEASWLEAAQEFDPLASNIAILEARLSGEAFQRGQIDFQRAEAFLPLLRKEIEAAAARPDQARLALAGIGVGSVVLLLRPVDAIAPAEQGQMDLPVSQIDPAVRAVMDLHDALGASQVPAVEIASRFNRPLLNAAARLVRTLADWDAELFMTWNPTAGRQVRSNLDRRAQDRALELFEESPVEAHVRVHGLVIELSLAGHFVLKPAPNAAQQKIHVSENRIQELGLSLGDRVTVWALQTTDRDSLGREVHERLEFLRFDDPNGDVPIR